MSLKKIDKIIAQNASGRLDASSYSVWFQTTTKYETMLINDICQLVKVLAYDKEGGNASDKVSIRFRVCYCDLPALRSYATLLEDGGIAHVLE